MEVKQRDLTFLMTYLPAGMLVDASYVSIRGKDDEEGAVQRYLNSQRIASIRDFTLEVGIYPASVILNWNHPSAKIERVGDKLKLPIVNRAAQIIDGQHRRAGIAAAIAVDPMVADFQVPITIFENLNTQRCGDIFISINTEQKPVPKSLVYDLFSEASEYIADRGVQRATDIARLIHEDVNSPYHQLIKFPGSRYERGGIALSTVVSAIRPLVEEKGDLDQIGITNLNEQFRVIQNYLVALSKPYSADWNSAANVFVFAAGFTAAMEFLRKRVVPYCNKKGKFTPEIMAECLGFDSDHLIRQDEVKGKGGKIAVTYIYDKLNQAFPTASDKGHAFEL